MSLSHLLTRWGWAGKPLVSKATASMRCPIELGRGFVEGSPPMRLLVGVMSVFSGVLSWPVPNFISSVWPRLTLDVGHLLMAGENPAQSVAMVGPDGGGPHALRALEVDLAGVWQMNQRANGKLAYML